MSTRPPSSSSSAASATTHNRARQYAHLGAQLAQLNAHLADTENLLRMTAVQAEYVRGLGGWMGGLFMASSKVLGEETAVGKGGGGGEGEGAAPEGGVGGETRR
ncbi:hypothetical protein MMC27_003756 [Xylographa pallens]|nr:hypothetical protein [Xylographa pallens]